jgi:hypothetical protein
MAWRSERCKGTSTPLSIRVHELSALAYGNGNLVGFPFPVAGSAEPVGSMAAQQHHNTVHFRGDNGGGATMCVEQAGAAVLDIAVEKRPGRVNLHLRDYRSL